MVTVSAPLMTWPAVRISPSSLTMIPLPDAPFLVENKETVAGSTFLETASTLVWIALRSARLLIVDSARVSDWVIIRRIVAKLLHCLSFVIIMKKFFYITSVTQLSACATIFCGSAGRIIEFKIEPPRQIA